jgi:hypothetical protein
LYWLREQERGLLCKELVNIGEGFEFEGVAREIEKQHGGLFAEVLNGKVVAVDMPYGQLRVIP